MIYLQYSITAPQMSEVRLISFASSTAKLIALLHGLTLKKPLTKKSNDTLS
jgi:hypothetical protein